MATDSLTSDFIPTLPAEVLPDVDHLVTEDETPVDNVFSEKQQRLLTEPLYSSWSPGRPFIAMSNVGLFYATGRPPFVPDALLSLDVELPGDLWPKAHRSYFTWLYGKVPDVVIEVVSNREGGEDSEKLAGYARVGVRYYVIFDPEGLLGPETLRAYRLEGLAFHKMDESLWFPDVGLGLQLWNGPYEDHENTWLRWVDAEGRLVATGSEWASLERERANSERERADSERERAELERRRADQLAEQLRQLGVEPKGPPA
jgi:Uma2 family endonuclease